MRQEAIDRFVTNIERIICGEEFDLYEARISSSFEYIAAEILTEQLENGIWYDGVSCLKSELSSSHQVKFTGNMHVCMGQEKFWDEKFISVVTDKRDSGEGILVYIKVGDFVNEQELFSIDWEYKNT